MKRENFKTKIACILFILLVLCVGQVFSQQCGDVNSSGEIDIIDALIIAQAYVGLNPANYNSSAADVNADGGVDIVDALLVAQYYVGLISSLNCGTGTSTPAVGATPTPPVAQGTSGYATRFWDCCKPHCAWDSNVPAGMSPLETCTIDGVSINPDPYDQSACTDGSAYMCYKYIPWAVNSTLSYGFGATSSTDVCGKCFELQFTGEGHHGGNPGASAIAGKRMIIQAINMGYDVEGGQIDIMVPGGGVGAYNGCSTQWGIPNDQLGAQYGGLLTACQEIYGYQDHEALKNCLRSRNNELFRSRGLTRMAEGLDWFIDWYEAADNPVIVYKEVPCPQELVNISGMQRP